MAFVRNIFMIVLHFINIIQILVSKVGRIDIKNKHIHNNAIAEDCPNIGAPPVAEWFCVQN